LISFWSSEPNAKGGVIANGRKSKNKNVHHLRRHLLPRRHQRLQLHRLLIVKLCPEKLSQVLHATRTVALLVEQAGIGHLQQLLPQGLQSLRHLFLSFLPLKALTRTARE